MVTRRMACKHALPAPLFKTLIRGEPVDLALDDEQLVDAVHGLNDERCLPQLGQLIELPASVRPASGLDDGTRLTARHIEPVEAA